MDRRTLVVLVLSTVYVERKLAGTVTDIEYYDEILKKSKPKSENLNTGVGVDPCDELLKLYDRAKDIGIQLDDLDTFLQKVKLACARDNYLYDSVEIIVRRTYTDDELKRRMSQSRGVIQEYQTEVALREISNGLYQETHFENHSRTSKSALVEQAIERLMLVRDKLSAVDDAKKHPALINTVSFTPDTAGEEVMQKALASIGDEQVFTPGWQCVRKQCGPAGGWRRGMSLLVLAMEFSYKSSMCLHIFRWLAVYNKPYVSEEKKDKKPLLYRMSLENNLWQDVLYLYQEIYANEHGVLPDMEAVDYIDADRYVKAKLQANGWHVIMEQYDPNQLNFRTVFDIIEKLEADGYDVQHFNIDYLAMIDKAGCEGNATGDDIRTLFRKTANFCKKKNIYLVTPHQISSDAFQLRRAGREEDFVKDVAGKGYIDGCRRLNQEPDMDMYTHVVHTSTGSFLTSNSYRHRSFKSTPKEDKFWIRKFENNFIKDDIYGPDLTRKKLGGGTAGGTEANEFWVED